MIYTCVPPLQKTITVPNKSETNRQNESGTTQKSPKGMAQSSTNTYLGARERESLGASPPAFHAVSAAAAQRPGRTGASCHASVGARDARRGCKSLEDCRRGIGGRRERWASLTLTVGPREARASPRVAWMIFARLSTLYVS